MKAKIRCDYISWSRFYSLSRKLSYKIHASGFKPDIIIAIGRGGYMPARIISDFLHVMNLTSFKIEHYRGTQKTKLALVRYPLVQEATGKQVLLVDDVCDTGDTFEVANKHLAESLQPDTVKSAVLHFKKTSSYSPDYYASRIIKWRWIIYPWAAAEDIGEFIKLMAPKPETVGEIKKILARDYDIRIPLPILKDIVQLSQP